MGLKIPAHFLQYLATLNKIAWVGPPPSARKKVLTF